MSLMTITPVARTMVGSLLRRPWPIVVVVCCSLASTAAAQSALTGIVHDPTGRVAAGATVIVKDTKGRPVGQTTVTSIGYFELELPDGDYQIEAHFEDFSFTGTVHVYPEEKNAYDIRLRTISQWREDVVAKKTALDDFGIGRATSATFSQEEINTLPLQNGRHCGKIAAREIPSSRAVALYGCCP